MSLSQHLPGALVHLGYYLTSKLEYLDTGRQFRWNFLSFVILC